MAEIRYTQTVPVKVDVEYTNPPLPVTIVRTSTDSEMYIAEVLEVALKAWLVMLLLPTFTQWNPSYWQSVAIVYTASLLFGSAGWLKWTKRLKR